MSSTGSAEDKDYDGVAKVFDDESTSNEKTKDVEEEGKSGPEMKEPSYDYKGWLKLFEQVDDGVDFFRMIRDLPQVKQRYGRTQMVNLACSFLANKTLKNGYKEHQKIIKLNKNGKFSFTALPYKKVGSKLLQTLGANLDKESCDFWQGLKQPIILTVKEATDLAPRPLDTRISPETHRWAFVAHAIKDPDTHALWRKLAEGPPKIPALGHDGLSQWYIGQYKIILNIIQNNVESYSNEFGDLSFSYKNPDTKDVREKKLPLKGIDPKMGFISDPEMFRDIKNRLVSDYEALRSSIQSSSNPDMSLDRIMNQCCQGNVFRTRLFYAACILKDLDISLPSRDSYLSTKSSSGNQSEPHRLVLPDQGSSLTKKSICRPTTIKGPSKKPRHTEEVDAENDLDEPDVLIERTEEEQLYLIEKEKIDKDLDFKRAEFILKNAQIFDEDEIVRAKKFMSLKKH